MSALGVGNSNIYIIPQAPYSLRNIAKDSGEAVYDRVDAFINQVRIIDWELPNEEMLMFEDVLNIDEEAQLFSATRDQNDYVVVTGDKKAIRALANTDACRPVAQRLQGRIICFEQVLQLCFLNGNFSTIRDKCVSGLHSETVLRSIFASRSETTQENAEAGLDSYVRELRSETGDLLADLDQILRQIRP
jgi:hypothetical protein